MIQKTMLILWLISILVFHLLFLTSTRFTLWPEMVVYPYLLNNGFKLYTDIINPYPPFLPLALAFFNKYLGYEPLLIQTLTWSIILSADLIIFIAANHIYKNFKKAVLTTAFFIFFSIPFGVNGIWFEPFQTPIIILSVFFFYKYFNGKNKKYLLLSSALLAVSLFIKQQTAWLVFWFFLLLTFKNRDSFKNWLKSIFIFAVPITAGLVFEIIIALNLSLLGEFLFWSVYLPFFKASALPGYILLPGLKELSILALIFLIFIPIILDKNVKERFFVFTAFAIIPFAYPRFDYFHLVPSIALLSIAFTKNLQILKSSKKFFQRIVLISFLLLLIYSVRFFSRNWTNEIRFFEIEVYQAARFIQLINPKDNPVFLQNVSGQILVVSKTLPTKPWADSFPWYLEINGVQEKIIEGIKTEKPQIVIYKPYESRGVFELASYRPQLVANFLDQNYLTFFKINDSLFLRKRQTE